MLIFGVAVMFFVLVSHGESWIKGAKHSMRHRELVNSGTPILGSSKEHQTTTVENTVSPQQFIDVMLSNDSTTLMKESFIESANGKEVTWPLKVENIEMTDGAPTGYFLLRYAEEDRDDFDFQTIAISASFSPSEIDTLLSVRKGERATVQGKLQFDENDTAIVDAKILNN